MWKFIRVSKNPGRGKERKERLVKDKVKTAHSSADSTP